MTHKVCFIILHYGENVDITCKSVATLEKLQYDGKIDIIVVCNGKEYDISDRLKNSAEVLVLDSNQGFSIGNNTGFIRAKEKDDYDFIIIMNNDVIVEQKQFVQKLYNLYNNTHFYVAGPDIYVPYKDFHSSPMRNRMTQVSDVDKLISIKHRRLRELKRNISIRCIKLYIMESLLNSDNKKTGLIFHLWRKVSKRNKEFDHQQENVVLQGSCLIFSRNFITLNEKAFLPEVFLYFEEDYLALRCKQNDWKTVYSGDLKVMHYHRGSSGLRRVSYREYCNRRMAIDERFLESAEQFKRYLIENTGQ